MTKLGQLPATAELSDDVIPVGIIIPWPSATPPSGNWLWCNGQAVSQSTYANLFSLIGSTYNTAGGLSAPSAGTFRTPPLCMVASGPATVGRTPVGKLSGTDSIAGSGGQWDHTHGLGDLSLPSHTHDSTGDEGRVQASHSHGHTLIGQSHWHSITNYRTYNYGNGKSSTVWNTGPTTTAGQTSPINGGVSTQNPNAYGISGAPNSWTLGGSLSQSGNGPYAGVYYLIKY